MTCFIILLCGCLFHLALLKYFLVKKRKGGERKKKKKTMMFQEWSLKLFDKLLSFFISMLSFMVL